MQVISSLGWFEERWDSMWDSDVCDQATSFPQFCLEHLLRTLTLRFHALLCEDTDCWNSETNVNFRLTSSEKGGLDMHVGSITIHMPKHLSVHHPIAQTVLFADRSNCCADEFSCPKSLAATKCITSMLRRQPSSASPNVYEADCVPYFCRRSDWVPSWQLSGDAFDPEKIVNINGCPSLAVLFEKSTDEVTASNVSSTQRASVSVMADEFEMKPLQAAPETEHSVNIVLDSGSSVFATETSPHQHYILDNLTDETSENPRPNNAPAINPLHETTPTPEAHKRTDEDSKHHSSNNPNPRVTERGILENTKRSDPWYVATGAAHHATGNRDLFTLLEVETSELCVHAADGTPMPVCGRGNVVTDTVVLSDVWYVPGLDVNLVSVGQLAELDYSIGFSRGSCTISSAADAVVGRARAGRDGLYEVDFLQVPLGMP